MDQPHIFEQLSKDKALLLIQLLTAIRLCNIADRTEAGVCSADLVQCGEHIPRPLAILGVFGGAVGIVPRL